MKVPNIRFNLKFFDDHGGEVVVRTIEDLKQNLNVSDLYAYMMDGTLARWLRGLRENGLVERIEKTMAQTDEREKVSALLSVFDLTVDEADLDAIVSSCSHERISPCDMKSPSEGAGQQERVREQCESVEHFSANDCDRNRVLPVPLKRVDFSGRSYYELLQTIRHKIKPCLGCECDYSADPSQDIAEMLAHYYERFITDGGFKEVPEVIPIVYLDWPDIGNRFRFEKVRSGPYVIDSDKCVACTSCVSSCPVNAIYGDGITASKIDAAVCVSCGTCEGACPAEAISSNEEWHIIVDNSTTIPLPTNCCAGSLLPTNGRWLVANELYLEG